MSCDTPDSPYARNPQPTQICDEKPFYEYSNLILCYKKLVLSLRPKFVFKSHFQSRLLYFERSQLIVGFTQLMNIFLQSPILVNTTYALSYWSQYTHF